MIVTGGHHHQGYSGGNLTFHQKFFSALGADLNHRVILAGLDQSIFCKASKTRNCATQDSATRRRRFAIMGEETWAGAGGA
jgi:hypothetical protein